jgi:hypothetical protein
MGQLSAKIHPENEKTGQRLTAIRMEVKRHASELDHCFIFADAGFINPALIRCSGNQEETAA